MPVSKRLKNRLDSLVRLYHKSEFIHTDPLGFVHTLRGSENRELAAFIVSLFTFGTVKQILRTATALFDRIPVCTHPFVLDFKPSYNHRFIGLKHRFITDRDFMSIFNTLHIVINEYGTIESFFADHHKGSPDLKETIIRFSEGFRSLYRRYNSPFDERTLRFIFASPASGCAAKRMNLFLRWMVRNDEIDLGLWTVMDKKDLILPLDTHTARISRKIGLTKRKSPGWAMAKEITERLKECDPEDPVKYDFALTRLGMLSSRQHHISTKSSPAFPSG